MRYFTMIVLCTLLSETTLSQQTGSDIGMFGWIAGCWELEMKGRVVTEHWMKPSGKTMMGMSRSVKDGKTYDYEFLRLVEEDDGSIQYVARPSGQEGASFTLVVLEKGKAVFENMEHDFPQRIIYQLVTSDSLIARIEGMKKGKERGIDFPYRKVKCD